MTFYAPLSENATWSAEAKKKAEVRPAFLRVPNKFGQKNGYTNFAMDEQASKAGSVSGDENGDYMVIYDNDDSIYATLKDGNAQTDSAVLSLIDSLASGELPDKYTVSVPSFLSSVCMMTFIRCIFLCMYA